MAAITGLIVTEEKRKAQSFHILVAAAGKRLHMRGSLFREFLQHGATNMADGPSPISSNCARM